MARANFYLSGRDNPQKQRAIMLYVRGIPRGNKTPIVFATGEFVPKASWDAKRKRVKPSFTGSPEMNALLDKYESDALKLCREFAVKGDNTDFQAVRDALTRLFKPELFAESNDFFDVFDRYTEAKAIEWQPASLKKAQTLKNYLRQFAEETAQELRFESIDKKFQDGFTLFLLKRVGLQNNSVAKTFGHFRSFMNWCAERAYTSNLTFKTFRMKTEKIEVIALTREELTRLYNFDFAEHPSLDKVRDVFCFQCFTGQRFSDIAAFRYNAVIDNVWHVRTTKTRDVIHVPLTDNALAILDKYREHGALPIISSQKTNEYVKEACKIAGIDQPVTITRYQANKRIERHEPKYNLIATHTARRSFVTLSLESGMRPEVLMRITGHTSLKMLNKYIAVSEAITVQEMAKAWNI
jgi:site-specific recombinase XerD